MSTHVASDVPLHLSLAVDVQNDAKAAAALIHNLNDKIAEEDTSKGLSFLELKNTLMTDYLCNLSQVLLLKASGKKLEGSKAIERLVTNRTVLEKMRPIEQKLKYQINKAIKVADSGEIKANDPMHFKANPSALVSKLGEEEEEEEDDEEEGGDKKKTGKYVVPKHVPAYFDEDLSKEDLAKQSETKQKKQMLSQGLIEDLKRQHLETPEEVYEQEDVMKKRHIQEMKERIRYEEDNFLRLPMSKKAKHARRQMSTVGTIGDEVTSFGLNYFSDKKEGGKKRKRGFKKGSAKKKFRK